MFCFINFPLLSRSANACLIVRYNFFYNKNIYLIELNLYFNSKRELYRSLTRDVSYTTIAVHLWHMDINMRDLRDRCDGNINMKLNDEHAYALIVDLKDRILRVCLRVAL